MYEKHQLRSKMTLAMAASAFVVACAVDEPTSPQGRTTPSKVIVASQFHVTSTADDGTDGTLRKEIADAANDDTVTIDASLTGQVINLPLLQLNIDKRLTILGPSAPGVTIRGNGDRVFNVLATGALELQDVTITGGNMVGDNGGAINALGPLVLKRVTVIGNRSTIVGGGVHSSGPLHIFDSRIIDNEASLTGGGIYVSPGGVGGALGGPVVISRTTVGNNRVTSGQGGGGGIFFQRDALVDQSTISGNQANTGGGILVLVGTTTVVNSTVSGNTAGTSGGGIYFSNGAGVLRHATITANHAGGAGGGVHWVANTSLTFANTIVSGNTAIANRNCLLDPGVVYLGDNVFQDSSCGGNAGVGIIANALLGPLADNGGPTQTHKLLIGSPAIDAAPACVVSDDQRGVTRPQGPKCDVGATEFTDYVTSTVTIDPSGTTNQSTGVAVVSGTHTCSVSTPLTLRVTVKQKAKAKKVPTEIVGSADINVTCSAQALWAAAVPPLTGAFSNSPVSVTVQAVNTPAGVAPVSVTAASVTMAWSRR